MSEHHMPPVRTFGSGGGSILGSEYPLSSDAAYMRNYMRDYRTKHPETQKQWEQAARDRYRTLRDHLKDKPCADCGIKYSPWVMQFDHLADKVFTIGKVGRSSEKKLLEEAAKCDVVCANCHADRTHSSRMV